MPILPSSTVQMRAGLQQYYHHDSFAGDSTSAPQSNDGMFHVVGEASTGSYGGRFDATTPTKPQPQLGHAQQQQQHQQQQQQQQWAQQEEEPSIVIHGGGGEAPAPSLQHGAAQRYRVESHSSSTNASGEAGQTDWTAQRATPAAAVSAEDDDASGGLPTVTAAAAVPDPRDRPPVKCVVESCCSYEEVLGSVDAGGAPAARSTPRTATQGGAWPVATKTTTVVAAVAEHEVQARNGLFDQAAQPSSEAALPAPAVEEVPPVPPTATPAITASASFVAADYGGRPFVHDAAWVSTAAVPPPSFEAPKNAAARGPVPASTVRAFLNRQADAQQRHQRQLDEMRQRRAAAEAARFTEACTFRPRANSLPETTQDGVMLNGVNIQQREAVFGRLLKDAARKQERSSTPVAATAGGAPKSQTSESPSRPPPFVDGIPLDALLRRSSTPNLSEARQRRGSSAPAGAAAARGIEDPLTAHLVRTSAVSSRKCEALYRKAVREQQEARVEAARERQLDEASVAPLHKQRFVGGPVVMPRVPEPAPETEVEKRRRESMADRARDRAQARRDSTVAAEAARIATEALERQKRERAERRFDANVARFEAATRAVLDPLTGAPTDIRAVTAAHMIAPAAVIERRAAALRERERDAAASATPNRARSASLGAARHGGPSALSSATISSLPGAATARPLPRVALLAQQRQGPSRRSATPVRTQPQQQPSHSSPSPSPSATRVVFADCDGPCAGGISAHDAASSVVGAGPLMASVRSGGGGSGWPSVAGGASISPQQRSARVASPCASAPRGHYSLPLAGNNSGAVAGGCSNPDLASRLLLPRSDDARRAVGAQGLSFTCTAAALGIPGCLTLAEWQQQY